MCVCGMYVVCSYIRAYLAGWFDVCMLGVCLCACACVPACVCVPGKNQLVFSFTWFQIVLLHSFSSPMSIFPNILSPNLKIRFKNDVLKLQCRLEDIHQIFKTYNHLLSKFQVCFFKNHILSLRTGSSIKLLVNTDRKIILNDLTLSLPPAPVSPVYCLLFHTRRCSTSFLKQQQKKNIPLV